MIRILNPAPTGQNKPAQGNPPWVSEASPWESASAPRHRVASNHPAPTGQNKPAQGNPPWVSEASPWEFASAPEIASPRPPRPNGAKQISPGHRPGGRHQPPFHRALKGQNNPHVPSHTGRFVVRVQSKNQWRSIKTHAQEFRQAFMVRRRSSPSIEPAIGRIEGD